MDDGVVVIFVVGGQIVSCQPAAQPVEVGKQDPLVDVRLIELVSNLPLERCGYAHPPAQLRVPNEPLIHAGG
jgi:hypothetical protein